MGESVVSQHQPSLTEWFAAIGEIEESNAFRKEDNAKADRLNLLKEVIELPYRSPQVFPAADAMALTPEFAKVLEEQADESCAFRLVPRSSELPKLRNRGLTVRACYDEWFTKLNIDFSQYDLHIFPNEQEIAWSTIFVISKEAVFGEIIRGPHSQLTQGETKEQLYQFSFDFQTWKWSEKSAEAQQEIEDILETLHVPDADTQAKLTKELNAEFTHDYLIGYFETTKPEAKRHYYIDYNRMLPGYLTAPDLSAASGELHGAVACQGEATGIARIITPETIATATFNEGDILVSDNTDVRYLPLMQKAGAILTERGGMLSHAAIVARELKTPCIIGIKKLLATIQDGERVAVDATKGTVERHSRSS